MSIDYYWFYSTVAQCLAALIGIGGVFAVFRLQVQQTFIENGYQNAQPFIENEKDFAVGVLSYLSKVKIIKELENTVTTYNQKLKRGC